MRLLGVVGKTESRQSRSKREAATQLDGTNDSRAGRGRLFLDPAKHSDDLRLFAMAIKQRWKIDEAYRNEAVERLREIMQSSNDEIALKAIAQVRALEAQNQKDEHKVIDVHVSARLNQLDALAADLGIEVEAIEDATRQASGGDRSTENQGDGGKHK